MPTPKLSPTQRFINPGTTTVYYVPVIAALALSPKDVGYGVPTRVELDAGLDLTKQIGDSSGWTVTGNDVAVDDLGSTFANTIPGKTSAADSSLTYYADKGGDDVRAVQPRGTVGAILLAYAGDETGNLADVYPIEVKSVGKAINVAGTAAMMIPVQYSISDEPAEDVVLPATA